MSKVSRLRAARPFAAPCVLTVMGLAVVCTYTLARYRCPDGVVCTRRAGTTHCGLDAPAIGGASGCRADGADNDRTSRRR